MSGATLASRLARKRQTAAAVLWTERLALALAPSATLLLGFAALAWLGLIALLPPAADLILLATVALVAAGAGWVRGSRLRGPNQREIDQRLECAEPHRPLTTLADHPAFPGANAIWQVHRERALARVPYLKPGPPRLGRPATVGLGGAAALAVLGLLVAGASAPARLWHALTPPLVFTTVPAVRLQAWILPPKSMGLPPIFLHEHQTAAVAAPPGSQLTVSLIGGKRPPSLHYGARVQRFVRLDRGSFQSELTLTESGTAEVWRGGSRVAQWRVAAVPDRPPTVALTGPATVADARLRLPWRAADDYGLATVTAELHLRDRPGATPVEVALPISGQPRTATGAALPDLTAQPWAGLQVLLRYVARDNSGQRGVSPEVAAVLPERVFLNPVARALIGIRRGLVINPADTAAADAALDQLSGAAAAQLTTPEWLNLRAIAALLFEQPGALDQAQLRLWQLALQIEDAGVADAKQRLAQARDALRDAMAAPPSPAQQQQIEALTRALQQAMQQYLQAMEKQAARAGQAPPQQEGGKTIDAAQLQQMAKQMEDAARAGRLEEAQQRLQQLGALLDSLKQSGKLAGNTQAPQQHDPALDKLLADQRALQNHADQRLSDSGDPRATQAPERDPDEAASQADPAAQRQQDAKAQAELRQRLGALAQQKGDQTGSVPDGLAHADGAMRDAQAALAKGDDQGARTAQQRAIDGMRGAGNQGQQAGNQPGQGEPGQQPGKGTDPLGRSVQEGGDAIDEDTSSLPTQGDAARSRALRDELRRRAADRTRPPAELDYIERLLSY